MNRQLTYLSLLMLFFGMLVSGGQGRSPGDGPGTEFSKSLDLYWSETDLAEADLLRFLKDDTCHANERNFLACVNAVSSIAERLRLKVTTSGQVHELGPNDMEKRLTERADLEVWAAGFRRGEFKPAESQKLSFIEIWLQLKSRIDKPAKINSLLASGINSFMSVSKDPHTYIVPLAYYEEILAQSEGKAQNLGFIARRIRGGAVVRKVFTGSPAEVSGLKKGDRILELNGVKVSELHSAEFSEMIRGQTGGRLLLKVERLQGENAISKNLEILPALSTVVSVESRVVQQGGSRLGLLTINKFARETCALARRELVGLMEQSVAGILLDLRDNPGGQVDESACVAGLFLPEGSLIFQTKYLDPLKTGEAYYSEEEQLYAGPLAVLINGGSASAAEIVAGALKDMNRAVLVGERSFGKGSFQDGMMWRSRSKIALFQTQGFYYFPTGWTPQIVGLEPDIPVKLNDVDTLREEDLYLVPLRPLDLWDGPQSLSWLHQPRCQPEGMDTVGGVGPLSEDIQVKTAFDWIRCGEGLAKNASQSN